MLRGLMRVLSGLGRLSAPFGVFAVIAVGMHAGADRVDDHALVALNAIDAVVDEHGAAALEAAMTWLGYGASTVTRWSFGFVELVDLETKSWLARFIALFVELVGDAVFAIPIFFAGERRRSARVLLEATYRDPTLLRVVAPLAAALLAWAGALTIGRELSVAAHAAIDLADGPRRLAELGAAGVAGLVLGLVLWRLAARGVGRAVRWADRVSDKDRQRRSARRHRLRGWALGLVVLPVAGLAVVEAVPALATLRALFAVS